jgi:hypothetical protein
MLIRSTQFKYRKNVSTKHVTRHYTKPLLAAGVYGFRPFLIIAIPIQMNQTICVSPKTAPKSFRPGIIVKTPAQPTISQK